jgi:nucleoside-diphosphate kinase
MERSLVLIKPDAIQRGLAGAIINRLQQVGLRLVAIKMIHLDKALAQRHYAVHTSKPFFKQVVEYITSAPIIAIVFEGEAAVAVVRKTMGTTDPTKAEVGTIRGDFGLNIERNAVHGSDSIETAEEEIKLFFAQDEIFSYLSEADSQVIESGSGC